MKSKQGICAKGILATVTLLCAAFFLCIPMGVSAGEALRADYVFTQNSPGATLARVFGIREFVDGEHRDFSRFEPVPEYFAAASTLISADRKSVMMRSLTVDFVKSPIAFAGEVDLGPSGRLPYRVEITDAQISFKHFDAPLAPDLTFASARSRMPWDFFLTIKGTVEVQGQAFDIDVVEFDGSPETLASSEVGGDVDGDCSSLFLDLGANVQFSATARTPPPLEVFTGLIDGFNVKLVIVTFIGGRLGNEIVETVVAPDSDKDGRPDLIDDCPTIINPNQTDADKNGVGDACNDKNHKRGQRSFYFFPARLFEG
jgi:hypothetical protein